MWTLAHSHVGWTPGENRSDLDLPAAPLLPAPEERRKPRRGAAATSEVLARASELGLTGPLGLDSTPEGASRGGSFARRLESELLASASDAWDVPRLASALAWVGPFVEATGRTLFYPSLGSSPEAMVGKMWNRRTLDLLTKYITSSAPIGVSRGDHVTHATAKSYSQSIYLLRCREADYDIAPTGSGGYAGVGDGKTTKRKEPPPGDRGLSTGLRAVHFSAAAVAGFDRVSARGELEWCAGIGSHNLLLRGGELGVPDNARSEPRRTLRGRHLSWRAGNRASKFRLWLLVWVIPIKDPAGNHKGYPTPVARRHDGPLGADPLCAYDAFARLWWRMAGSGAPFPLNADGTPRADWWLLARGGACLELPLFTRPSGSMWTTEDSRKLFKRIAEAAGIDPSSVGGKASRIGGSTDAKDRTGEAGKAIIKRRGRWASDVAEVYQRELLG